MMKILNIFTNKKKFKRKVFGNITRFINTDTGELEMMESSNDQCQMDITLGRAGNVMIGMESLVIGLDGTVTSGNSCFHDLKHGNIMIQRMLSFQLMV